MDSFGQWHNIGDKIKPKKIHFLGYMETKDQVSGFSAFLLTQQEILSVASVSPFTKQ